MYTVHVTYKKHRAQSAWNEAEAIHFAKALFQSGKSKRHGKVKTLAFMVIIEVGYARKPSKEALIKRLMEVETMPRYVDWITIAIARGNTIIQEFEFHATTRVATG